MIDVWTDEDWRLIGLLRDAGERIAIELGFAVLDIATIREPMDSDHLDGETMFNLSSCDVLFSTCTAVLFGTDPTAAEKLLRMEFQRARDRYGV